jgi:uracil-DNA glycosylase family 4
MNRWDRLNREIVACKQCTRLRDYCREVAQTRRRAFRDESYWGRPLPNFGDPQARLLIVGLAPAAHGGNRTGRMFTGDRSGDWLYRALHDAGFANQPNSTDRNDGLTLIGCAITAACHCAPPDNKPTPDELAACRTYLLRTIDLLPVRVFLALGQIGWRAVIDAARHHGWWNGPLPKFGHNAVVTLAGNRRLVGSYHPSQQNTFTGRLTREMLADVFETARSLL